MKLITLASSRTSWETYAFIFAKWAAYKIKTEAATGGVL